MKILHIISQRPDSTGSGIYLQAILSAASQSGHDNFLLAALQDNIEQMLHGVESKNCTFIHFNSKQKDQSIVGMSDAMPYPSRKFRDLCNDGIEQYLDRFREPIKTMVTQFQPDILHTHHLWLLSSLVRSLFPDLSMVTSCHGSDLRQFQQCPHLRARVLEGCREIDSIFALSSEQKEEIANLYEIPEKRITVTGGGFNEAIFYQDQKKVQSNHILYAGKLSRAKGIPWLLDAISELKQDHFHLHLAGGGVGEEYRQCLRKAASLENKVTIHGALSQRKIAELMRSSPIFILPSLYEGLPLVVLEALACGCHVIATDLPGTREIQEKVKGCGISLIKTPIVKNTDSTLLENEPLFVSNIKTAVEKMLTRRDVPVTNVDLDYFTWGKVFDRIEKTWIQLDKT